MTLRRIASTTLSLIVVLAAVARANVLPPGVTPAAAGYTTEEIAQGYRAGVLLAKPRATRRANADSAEPGEGFTLHRKYSRFGDLRVLKIPAGQSVAEAMARLKATGRYEFVEPDYLRFPRATPNDPNYSFQWSLANFGQTGGANGADIHAQLGWDVLHDAPNVIVAIIDSGMRLTHSDLAGNLWTNPSPTVNDLHGIRYTGTTGRVTSGDPTDDEGHGTHVAGIIGAVGNNGVGITGVAWKVQLMPLKFLTTGGGAPSDEIACIDYAIAHGVSIINASFGASYSSSAELAAITAARDAGIIFVAAAGNGDSNGVGFNTDTGGDYPAGYLLDNIVTVASSDAVDNLSSFSNFGSGSVDLAAPGERIYSTYYSSDTSYQTFSGTSMATPHVAGALALLKAKFPNDTYRQLINRLLRSVTVLPGMVGKLQSGGRLNLQGALNSTDNRPLNDDFASRATLTGANVRVRSSNAGATAESASGEPNHAGVAGGASLWWTWTAPATTEVTFDTAGSTYDTLVAVYTGSTVGGLIPVGSNDDAAAGTTTSRVALNVTAGTVYQIAVDGKGGATGQTNLRIGSVPANDNFAKAQTVAGSSFVVTGSNLNASSEPGEPKPIATAAGQTVWFKWVAPKSGHFQLSAFATQADTTAAVFTGSAVNALTTVASNDDASSPTGSFAYYDTDALVPFDAIAGQTYYFAVDNSGSEGADFVLSLVDAAWEYATVGSIMSSPAAASDGTIYFGAGATDDTGGLETRVHAVNPNGTVKWTRTTNGPFDVSSPAVGPDGTVYIGGGDGFFYALNASNGTRKWRFTATTAIGASPAIASDGTIYFHDDSNLYALTDNTTAAVRKWSFSLNSNGTNTGTSYASPALATDGTIYLGTTGGKFYAIDPAGAQKWVFTADGDVFTSAAIGGDGTIYFGTTAGNFYALRPDGTQLWKWITPTQTTLTSSPAIGVDGTIYFAGYDKNLYALRSDGTLRWTFTAADRFRASSPAIGADGTIYIGNYDSQVYAVNPDGTLQRTFATGQLIRSSPLIANNRLYFGSNDVKLYAIDLGQGAAGSAWPMFRQNATRMSRAVSVPVITSSPRSQTVGLGGSLALTVTVAGSGPFSYQWKKDGVAIAGANASTLVVASATAATAGRYTVDVTASGGGTATSSAATVTTATAVPARLTNLSVQTTAGGSQILTLGFVLNGSPNKNLLIRGIGPGLAPFGLTNVLADPVLRLFDANNTVLQSNSGWQSTDLAAMTATGAFPLSVGSKDAAFFTSLAAGNYTAQITGTAPGQALAEVYDTAIGTGAKLINLSTMAQVTAGGSLTAGFTISGNVAKTVLIRGLGPAIAAAPFNISGAISDPKLELYDGASNLLQTNDDWGATQTLIDAFGQTGAFKLGTAQTKDAVLLVTLAPGGYTAVVRGVNNTSGLALVEIYEVP